MNKIYKLVWNQVRGCYVVASEFAKAHGKSARRAVVGAFVATAMVGGMGTANAATTGEGAVIYGYEVEASRTCTAWGDKSKAVGEISTAFGFGTYSSGRTSTAWGDSTTASGDKSTAFGFATVASGDWSTAWGYWSKAAGQISTAFGSKSNAWGYNSLAALGGTTGKEKSKDLGYGAMAIGEGSLALDKFTYAIGNGAAATVNNALALGNGAFAKHDNSVALGSDSVTDRENCISVGNRQITFVRPGQLDTDAANVWQVREEKNRALAAEQANADAVSAEKVRAMTAEEANKKAIADLAAGKLLGDVENFKLGDAFTGELVETKEGKKYFAMDINEYGNIKFADMGKENLSVVLSGNGFYAQDSDATTRYETSLDEKELMIRAGDSKVSITAKGVDLGGSKITNVAAGEVDTDAVNVQQLNAAVAGSGKVDGQNIVKDADGTINLSDSVQTTLGQVANKADKSYVDAELSKKANVADINAELSKKANAVDVYTKTEADDKMVDAFAFGSSHIYGILEEHQADIDSLLGKSVLGGNSLEVGKGLSATYDKDEETFTVAIKENIDDTFHFAKATADITGKAVDINYDGVVASKNSGGIEYKTELTENGISVTKNNKGVNITSDGIDMGDNKITKVLAGDLKANSTDAVNGSQLYATNQAVESNKSAIAAEATRAKAAEARNAEAIENNTTEIIKNRADIETNRVHIEDNKDAILAEATRAKAAEAKNADAIVDEAKAREQGDADTLKKANNYTDESIKAITGTNTKELLKKIDNTNDRVDRVGATAAALAAINYQPMTKGQSQIAVGMGGYKGKKATALGLAYQISDRVSGSVAGSANGSERMFNVGFNYVFGQHSDKDIAQCVAVPGSMSLKEAELQAQVDALKSDYQALKADYQALKANAAVAQPVVQLSNEQIAQILQAVAQAIATK